MQEKNPTKNKAVSEFMVVNNTDHPAEQEIENKNLKRMKDKNSTDMSMDQPESSGAKGDGEVRRSLLNSGAGESENNPSKSTSFVSSKKSMKKQRESKVKREKIETGADEIPSISGLESSGRRKKKKKGTAQEGLPNQPDILPETSVDQSALETEELYLKMEKLNNEYWLQKGGSSSKRKDTGRSPSLMSGGKFPTEADDTEVDEVERRMKDSAQISSEHGKPKLGNTDGNRLLATGEANLAEGRDGHQDSHLLAGTTEASDREEDAILSQGHKEERPGKLHHEVFERIFVKVVFSLSILGSFGYNFRSLFVTNMVSWKLGPKSNQIFAANQLIALSAKICMSSCFILPTSVHFQLICSFVLSTNKHIRGRHKPPTCCTLHFSDG